jgi:hypothetical protein
MKNKILIAAIAGLASLNMAIAQPKTVVSMATAQPKSIISTETAKLSEYEYYQDITNPEFREALEDMIESEPEKAAKYSIKAGALHTAIDIYSKMNYEGLDKNYSKDSPFSNSEEPKPLFFKIIKEGEDSGDYKKALYFCDRLIQFYSDASNYMKEKDNQRSKVYNAISKDFSSEKEKLKERRLEKAAKRRVK